MPTVALIRSCLYNLLGYGNINGQVWLIGAQEGGSAIWRQKTKTLEESGDGRKKDFLRFRRNLNIKISK